MKLTLKDASFGYDKEKNVLNNINLTANSGELIAVLGPNGAGKTTLLKCIMGFLKWNKGVAYLDNENIAKIPPTVFWKRVSYVPQAKGSVSSMRVEDMILLGLANKIGVFSSPKKEDYLMVEVVAKQLKIEYLLNKKCSEISGGELQMVLIARALIGKPELLILDEPESNLDFKNQLIVLDAMSRLSHENNICCIFNTHYPTHALSRADKALLISKDGKAIFGNTPEVVTETNIEKTFGVRAIIGDMETEDNIYKNVLPLEISDSSKNEEAEKKDEKVIAVMAMVFSDFALADRINAIIHDYSKYIVGRMGVPYKDGGVYIINLTLDGPKSEIEVLNHKLKMIGQMSIKTTYSKRNDLH